MHNLHKIFIKISTKLIAKKCYKKEVYLIYAIMKNTTTNIIAA